MAEDDGERRQEVEHDQMAEVAAALTVAAQLAAVQPPENNQ